MKNHLKRWLLVLFCVSLFFQQVCLPMNLYAGTITTTFTNSEEKAGTTQDTKEQESQYEEDNQKNMGEFTEENTDPNIQDDTGVSQESTTQVKDIMDIPEEEASSSEEKTQAGQKEKDKVYKENNTEEITTSVKNDTQTVPEKKADDVEEPTDFDKSKEIIKKEKVQKSNINNDFLQASARANHSCNMPKATYETFILQGKEGKGQKIGNSGKVTMLPDRKAIQNDITAKHNDYVSFTPHWGADTSASLSSQAGSKNVSYYVNDPKKAQHVGSIGEAAMSPNIIGGRVFKLDASMKNKLSCTYYNVGRYYDRASGRSYAVDMKAVLVDFTKKPKHTEDVQNAIADGAMEEDNGPLFCFIGVQSIGVLTTFCDAVTIRYSFYIHGTNTSINLKGFARFADVDAQQGIEFSQGADYFYAINDANEYLGYSKGVYGSGSKAYIYALSSKAVKGNAGSAFYSLFSGSQLTLRYTFAKCSRQDDGGENNGNNLKKYKVPFDNSDVKDYSTSSSSGYIHFDAKQPYLAQPEIYKYVFNGNNIQGEIQTPHTAVSNELPEVESFFTYKVRTVCPYEDASQHHYSSWIIKDQISPFLQVEQAVVYDGTGNRSSDFRIQTQEQTDGSTIVTAIASNPAAQTFYEKNWYDLYITVRIKSQQQLNKFHLDFARQYISGGNNIGKYVITNQAVLSTGTNYTSNEVQTIVPQKIQVQKVNEEGKPIKGITFGIFTNSQADIKKEKPLMTAITGENGIACFKAVSFFNLAGKSGPYYVREISRGAYENVYLLDETWNYSFSSNSGNPVIFGEEGAGIATLEDVAKILKKYTVLIRKKNRETSNFLKGAVFSLYQWSETGKSYRKACDLEECTDEEGQFFYRNPEDIISTEDNLGRFMIKEEKAPYGCYNAEKSWTFETTDAYIEDNKNIEFFYTAENGRKKTQQGQLLYVNDLQKGIIKLVKTDETQAYVEGATFVIKAAEDIYAPWQYEKEGKVAPQQEPLVAKNTVCGYLKTDEKGNAVSKPLYIGTYLVEEIMGAPDHVMSEDIYEVKFTYPEKDDVTVVEENVQAGNVVMQPSLSVAKLAERTRNAEGQEVAFDFDSGRYCEDKIPGIYHADEVIRYHITVTNTGNTDLYHIRLTDTMDKENASGQKLSDYVDENRATFILPETGGYETKKGDHITVSSPGDNKKELLLSKLREGDSVTVYFDVPVTNEAANVYNLINKVSVTASYDNNEEQPGQHLIPVNTKELVDENGNLLTEDEDCIHIPGKPDDSVVKIADRTTGAIVTEGKLNGVKVPGLYYEGDTIIFSIHIKNTGTANLKNIIVTDVMSEELKQVVNAETASFQWKDTIEDGEKNSIETRNGETISVRQLDASRVILCEDTDAVTGTGTLRPGDSITLYFCAKVKKDAANFYDLKNTAIVNASYFNGEEDVPVPEKYDTDLIELPGVPEAKIAKIADRTTGATLVNGRYQNAKITGTYNNGDKITFTISVTNSGSADLYDLKVTDLMEERLLSALIKSSIHFKDGNYTTTKHDTIASTAGKGAVLILNRLKAGDSVNLLLQATVNQQAGDLFKLENKVYVTGHYRKGNEQYQQQYEESAQAAGHSYIVEYHANNGTEEKTSDSETPAHKGEVITINGNPFKKEASEFLGWNTKADGTGQDYAPGAEYQMPAQDIHLYARWGQKGTILKKNYTYALTYHSNNPLAQSYPDSETRCAVGTAVLLDENQFHYEGYHFVGWSLTPEKKETLLQPGESYRMPKKDMHLYAQWEKEERVMLTYHCNIPGREQKKIDFQTPCKKGENVTVKQCEFEREDYLFIGWSKEKGGTNVELHPQDKLTLGGNIDLYAVWQKEKDEKEEIKYSLIYHGNNETNDSFMDNNTPGAEGKTVILSQNLFTYDGYTFVGWNTKADGTGKTWTENESYTMPDRNVHLYAQWQKAEKYELTYISNYPNKTDTSMDEKKTDSETPCLEQSPVHIDGCSFQCDGYQFLGWSLAEDGNTELIRPGVEYIMSQDTQLYAIWSNDCEQYSLLYSSNTETPLWEAAPDSPSPAGTPQTLIKNPFLNTTAIFVGWSLDENATPQSEELLKPGQHFEQPARDTVLYAVWEEGKNRHLYYDGNGGESTSVLTTDGKIIDEETPCMTGTSIRINPCTFYREGFDFLGWSTKKMGPIKTDSAKLSDEKQTLPWEQAAEQTEILYPGCAYTVPEQDTILYAIWKESPETTFKEDTSNQDIDELAQSKYTPIPVTQLMRDNDFVNIPGQSDLRIAKKADRTKGVTLKKGRYQGKRKPGTYYKDDRVVYKITVSNYGTATAHQITIKEKPSAAWNKVMRSEGFTAFEGETLETVNGDTVLVQKKTTDTLTLDHLKPADSVTITYEAVVTSDQVKETLIKNTVKVTANNHDGLPVNETKYMKDKDVIQIVEKEKSSSSNVKHVPKTGDTNDIELWVTAGLFALMTAGTIIKIRRREKK